MRRGPRIALVTVTVVATAAIVALGVIALVLSRLGGDPAEVPAGWAAPAALPVSAPLPADRLAFDSDRTGTFEIFAVGTDGSSPVQLTEDDAYDSWSPRLSPDRRTILVHRAPAGKHDLDPAAVSIWAIAADGTGLVELRPAGLDGWVFQGHAEWSPDGGSLVLFGGSRLSPQIHVTDALGQHPRAVTDRGGTNLDPSFAPDGAEIVFVGCPSAICTERDYEIFRIPTEGGEAIRVTTDDLRDHDPYWSPDGARLAWLTAFGGPGVGVWDVRIAAADGADPVRLFGDAGVTSRPAFSADSRTVFVHRIPPGGTTFGVFRIGVDGAGPVEVTSGQPGSNEYPSP
ncbi:TolB family protein [Pengzhenrongella sicca]|uniref:PD40 domain-containing protein n=1 Tax=Pengzhenrongella sicca TaxID=2819238 RepID=A0A8A4ZFK6_9MICO|nr:hypothetical protein [Pengzhenrongella sicca]QTE29277.1 PD40 domain-containing protein [Pengzhenrongella sicca]